MTCTSELTSLADVDLLALAAFARGPGAGTALNAHDLKAAGLGRLLPAATCLLGHGAAAAGLVAEALLADRTERPVPRLELVWTGPEAKESTARDTAVVVREMLEGARQSVLVAGFRFDHGAWLLEPLYRGLRDRGVSVSIYLDVAHSGSGVESGAHVDGQMAAFLRENWPFGQPEPALFYDPRALRRGAYASLHAKCVVVDERLAFVTSANFTHRAQTRNVEVGVLIQDQAFSHELTAQWVAATAAGLFFQWKNARAQPQEAV